MKPTLKFYDVYNRKSASSSDWEPSRDKRGKPRVIANNKQGQKMYRYVSRSFYDKYR